jgi:hypothetical protein
MFYLKKILFKFFIIKKHQVQLMFNLKKNVF